MLLSVDSYDSFEAMLCKVDPHVLCSLHWYIDHQTLKVTFLRDFSQYLPDIFSRRENLLIVGDFNIHSTNL